MIYLVSFLIALAATTAGALTGMGGGVIIKPVLDGLGSYDPATIGVLSSITVFCMSLVSIAKQLLAKTQIPFRCAIPLAIGSLAGGQAGQLLFHALVGRLPGGYVTVVQNIALCLLILLVLLYMKNKARIPGLQLTGVGPAVLAGVFLGVCSSFLGIGGGPINVALLIWLFSFDAKTAAICSLITILFAQASKLGGLLLAGGLAGYDLSAAPVMVVGAIAGGFLGAELNRKASAATVERAFNAVQLLVLALTVFNVVRNLV